MRTELSYGVRPARPRGARPLHAPIGVLLLVLGLILAAGAPAEAQHRVSGRVTSAMGGEPLAGIQIQVRGTGVGTLTDSDGRYAITAPSGDATLVFSSIGYADLVAPIGGRSVLNAEMAPQAEELEGVVVVGYGQKRKVTLTESIGTVSDEQIQRLPVVSADQAIQGRVPGVQITSVSGTPGAPVAVRIRGVGTVGNTQPLFVVDGVPIGKGEGEGGRGNPLSTINPADIESISVLKDASAAAVYGVQAANGVVLIQTKRGKLGKPTISYNAYAGVQRVPNLWDMNDTQAYVELTQAAYDAYNQQNNLAPTDKSYLTLHPDLQPGSRYLAITEDWLGDALNQNAPMMNHNLSVSGATEQLNYYISAGYYAQDAVGDRWDLDRLSFRANSDYQVNDWFRFGETFSISRQEIVRGVNAGGDGFLLRNAATMPPFFEIYDYENRIPGNRYGYSGNLNVAGLTIGNQNGINRIRDNFDRATRVLGGLFGEVDVFDRLTLRSQGSVDLTMSRDDSWNPGHTAEELGLDRRNQEYSDSRGESSALVWTNTASYTDSFGQHDVNLLGGVEVQRYEGTTLAAGGQQFLSANPNFYRVIRNAQSGIVLRGGAGESAFLGYIGRLTYDFADRYLLTASVRRDGTSTFSPEGDRRWGTFPSVSAGWRISEEPFFNLPAVSELKVRGSWGQLGNSETASYPHVFRVSPIPDYGLGGSTTVQAPAPSNFVNPDVTWETVETVDVGVEGALFDARLDFMATYYRRTTKDFLIFIPIPQITGFGSAPVNAGSVLNRGWELELGYNSRFLDAVDFQISGNLTTVHNELTDLAPGIEEFMSSDAYRTAIGYPIGYLYGFQTDGIYQTPEEAAAALRDRTTNRQPQPGDVRFRDTNGPAPDGAPRGQQFSGEPDGEITFHDRTYLGKTIPDFFYGLNLNAFWKGFDASLFVQGVQGVELYNEFRRQAESLTGGGRNMLATTRDRWTGPGTSNTMPRAVQTDPNSNNRFSDRWVEDGSYMRLKNVQIGYALPDRLLGAATADARIYVAATNLWTLTGYSGLDPEVMTNVNFGNGANASQLAAGTDQGNFPQPRFFQIGVNVGF